ncbi:hypothetical protein PXK58_02320 [Phaeobacter gallaeciensis]|uniref:hypothetical protein n=1 Tax=Phaeobacter gallaeciensis TaxID=60890 RepID=UPI0023804F7C|nr:hypothetical protein [Phaeobacter gallaeciensis]MDE4272674.1 hypothetical protein [Phaeobacter gallaeciensis]MDE4298373.1 hypothetical protein [Phaeobacter gallaeciensis]MDE5183561.1 hypothetical protein [Phaeobacter gallaeciensis]
MTGLPDWLSPIMQWVVLPALGWLGLLHNKQSKHATDIAVLQTKADAHTRQHEQIMSKLDQIEEALRKN